MAKTAAVVDLSGKAIEPPAKKKRERICLIETMPKPEWVVKTTNARGRTIWYLRMEITGLLPRRFGPFKSRYAALLVLDDMLNTLTDNFSELDDAARKRMLGGRYQHRWELCVLEDELGQQYRTPKAKRTP